MGKADLYVNHDKLRAGAGESAPAVADGVSAAELIAVASDGGLMKRYVKKVLDAAGLQAVTMDWEKPKATTDVDLLAGFMPRAIQVTKARKALSGPLMEKAQLQIQIIKNERTQKEALLLSEALLEQILEGQANEMVTEILRLKEKISEKDEARFAARSRQGFLNLRKSMETIKAEVSVVDGTKAAADLAL